MSAMAAFLCCAGAMLVVLAASLLVAYATKVLMRVLSCDDDMTCRCGGEFELVKERRVMTSPNVGVRKWKCRDCGAEFIERFHESCCG